MFMSYQKLSQVGDTIVEVMISVVVLSLVVGGAYSVANRSLKMGRQAQERSEALKLAESQLENIKAKAATATDPALFSASGFCFNPTDTITTSNCLFNNLYRVSIDSDPVGASYQFNITVEWDSLGLTATEQIVMRYRVLNEGS